MLPPAHGLRLERLEQRNLLSGTPNEWSLQAIEAPAVWQDGYTGKGVLVAVIDTGISVHSDLFESIWVNKNEVPGNRRDDDGNGFVDDVNGWDFVADDNGPVDTGNHGTHVAGTIAAARNRIGTTGIAYDAEIMPIRTFNEAGDAKTSDLAAAIRYAVDNGADIINLSAESPHTTKLKDSLRHARDHNVLVVAASGNDAGAQPKYPALYSNEFANVISVGAYDHAFRQISRSNPVGTSGAVQVDAPGEGIFSSGAANSFSVLTGTSAAAAHVSGIAALTLSANPDLAAENLRDIIVQGASARLVEGSDSQGAANAAETVVLALEQDHQDIDGDGVVGFADFLRLGHNFGKRNVGRAQGDLDGDGYVNFSDFLILSRSFGTESEASARRSRNDAVDTVFAEDRA